MIGRRFGRLIVLARAERVGSYWQCACDCGTSKAVRKDHLIQGHVVSCGCRMRETGFTANLRHGKTQSSAHHIWTSMLQRCENPRNHAFPRYGARGIKVCDRWQSFNAFLADVGEPHQGMTLDRIDNDGNYEPGNWRWASRTTQARNRSTNVVLECDGVSHTVAAWAEKLGVSDKLIYARIARGWSPRRALKEPSRSLRAGWAL